MLELRIISKTFPGLTALDGVSFKVQPGEIHALCGENGAGKSTLLNILTGNIQPSAGQLLIWNKAVVINGPAQAEKLGIAIVYQHLSLVDSLTVAENIFANRQAHNRLGLIQYRTLLADSQALLDQLNLTDIRPDSRVAELSAGQKQMVEIAKALSQNPDILLLDEPTASLTERETQTLFALLRQLRTEGKAIVYVSHRLTEIFALADRVSVLKDGRYQGTRSISELTPDKLIRLMVGRDLIGNKTESAATGEVLLSVSGLSGERFREVSFELHRGEILGLAGLIGAGRTEIARAIFGADALKTGQIRLKGAIVSIQHPNDAVKLGIGYLPEERKALGLFAGQSVAQNIVAVPPPGSSWWFNPRRVIAIADQFRQTLGIKTPSVHEPIDTLSGGNQQKVMLARWLLTNPDVLIVDEPTHGIDVGAKAEIYDLVRKLAKQGKGIILISSELPELLSLSDRILVLRDGQLTGEFTRAEATEERIMNVATSYSRT
ncbi:MAG: sugar ABC transporter ATP-binding protein [Rudanella sp.]|nr:sugar ABC transporter ATP-binding protein [Rudanella sp.]